MKPLLVSRIATFLLAPVLLSVGCLSCLVQVAPVYAATSPLLETVMDRSQDCEPSSEPAPVADSIVPASLPAHTPLFSDRSVHVTHGLACGLAYAHVSPERTQLERSVFYPIVIASTPGAYQKIVLQYHPFSYSRPPPTPYNRFLTGTTIKKE